MSPPVGDAPSPPGDADPQVWHPVAPVPQETPQRPLHFNWFGHLAAARQGRRPFDPRRPAHWLAAAAVGLPLVLLLGGLAAQVLALASDQGLAQPGDIVLNLVIAMLLFIGGPVVWVLVLYEGGAGALRTRLFLTSHAWVRDTFVGIGVAFLGLFVSFLMVLLFTALGLQTDNPVVEDLGGTLSWALVVFIPFAAATSEEVFFRGLLHPKVGAVPANVLFGFVHLSYQTPLQVLVPMMLGFLFSWVLLRRRSLYPAIVAHFVFNLVALTVAKLAHDLGWDTTTAFWM